MPVNNRRHAKFRLPAQPQLAVAFCGACLLAISTAQLAHAAPMHGRTDVIATSGQLAPNGVSVISQFGAPVINDQGQLAFTVAYTGSSLGAIDAILQKDAAGFRQIAAKGQTAPNSTSTFQFFAIFPAALNEQGEVAFWSAGGGPMGVFRASGNPTVLETIALANPGAPSDVEAIRQVGIPSVNDHGDIALWAPLSSVTPGPHALFRTQGGSLIEIVRNQDAVPNSTRRFWEIGPAIAGSPPPIIPFNNSGEVAFWAELVDSDNVRRGNWGIYRGDDKALAKIAQTGDPDPGGIGSFSRFESRPVINDVGQVAFMADIRVSEFQVLSGVYLGDGTSTLKIAVEDQIAPDGNGHFDNFGLATGRQIPAFVLNNLGQVAFPARLPDATDGATAGIFRGDGSSLTQIVRLNDLAPDGNGRFSNVDQIPVLNDAGQVAFDARLSNTAGGTTDDAGIFLFDDTLGLIQVAREGDALLGSVITGVGFFDGEGRQDEFIGLSQTGTTRLAFVFGLADGRRGIAVWSLVPEPGSFVLTCLAMIGLGGARVRRRSFLCECGR